MNALNLGGGITLPILDTMPAREAFECGMLRLVPDHYMVDGVQVVGVNALNQIWVKRDDGSFVMVGRR